MIVGGGVNRRGSVGMRLRAVLHLIGSGGHWLVRFFPLFSSCPPIPTRKYRLNCTFASCCSLQKPLCVRGPEEHHLHHAGWSGHLCEGWVHHQVHLGTEVSCSHVSAQKTTQGLTTHFYEIKNEYVLQLKCKFKLLFSVRIYVSHGWVLRPFETRYKYKIKTSAC